VRRITLFIVSTVASLVLLFSYQTSRGSSQPAAVASGPGEVGVVPGGDLVAAGSSAASDADNVTVNGTVAQTRWGPVQVQVIISNGKIADVKVLQYPDGNGRDQEINSYALPELHDQVIAAQSANIDGVSGATVTSRGYTQSLQAALDTAHFG
jgi:uncharacterized protein with FMN-binding domain